LYRIELELRYRFKMSSKVFPSYPSVDSRLKPIYRVACIHEHAVIPTRGSEGAAGYDLVACESKTIAPGEWSAVDTGIVFEFPNDVYARVAPRSGLAFKKGIQVGAGVVDSDYRDSIKVILFNHGKQPFEVTVGDRIAQVVFEKIALPTLHPVTYEELTSTERGTGGFGSTGQ
jgi:dUTP pyrophosphatase